MPGALTARVEESLLTANTLPHWLPAPSPAIAGVKLLYAHPVSVKLSLPNASPSAATFNINVVESTTLDTS